MTPLDDLSLRELEFIYNQFDLQNCKGQVVVNLAQVKATIKGKTKRSLYFCSGFSCRTFLVIKVLYLKKSIVNFEKSNCELCTKQLKIVSHLIQPLYLFQKEYKSCPLLMKKKRKKKPRSSLNSQTG